MPGPGSRPCPKGERRKTTKRRADARERAVVKTVREECVDRDGRCRIAAGGATSLLGACWGASELAHLEEHRRFKTRNQPPEERHQTPHACIMCHGHHQSDAIGYDRHRFSIEYLTPRGADGPLRYVRKSDGATFDERIYEFDRQSVI